MSNEKTTWCPRCNDMVRFETRDACDTTSLGGEAFTYPVHKAFCRTCGCEVTYAPYEEEAGLAFNDAVRASKGLVSLAVVRDLPKKYGIGKRPLSRLLGWGEVTYSRFVDGQVPSKAYSDRIQRLYDDPFSYLRLLTTEKDRLASIAYRKSFEAIAAILSSSYPDAIRLNEVGEFFIALAKGDLSAMALQKLTYYAQGFSLAFLGTPLFAKEPHAWAAGPVYGQLWHEFGEGGSLRALAEREDFASLEETSPFSCEEERLMRSVFDSFGRYSGAALSKMTHQESPWINARKRAQVVDGEKCNEPITLEDMEAFFGCVVKNYKIEEPCDILRYAEDAFNKVMES